jgi:hypothetical protein
VVGQALQHDADHCETDKRRGGSPVRGLEVAGKASVLSILQFGPSVTRVLREVDFSTAGLP